MIYHCYIVSTPSTLFDLSLHHLPKRFTTTPLALHPTLSHLHHLIHHIYPNKSEISTFLNYLAICRIFLHHHKTSTMEYTVAFVPNLILVPTSHVQIYLTSYMTTRHTPNHIHAVFVSLVQSIRLTVSNPSAKDTCIYHPTLH